MPAIDLTTLRIQIHELVDQSSNPDTFFESLSLLFEYYKNYTLRVEKKYIGLNLPSYNTPTQVLSFIGKELGKLVSTSPEIGLELATGLWNESYLEAKLLAVSLFGSLPKSTSLQLLSNFPEISGGTHEQEAFLPLMTNAFIHIRQEFPAQFIELISSWLGASDSILQRLGLKIIANMIHGSEDEDLPKIFEILEPSLRSKDPSTQTDLVECIDSLYTNSPSETLHFLVEALNEIDDSDSLKVFSRSTRKLPANLLLEINPIIKSKISSLRS